jgi:translation initiation factor 2 subunit 3
VVAANEGIKPQTIEHLAALQAKKVKNLIVVQNKIDLVDIEQAKKNYKEIKELLKGKYDRAPIIPVSALQEINIDKIYEAIANIPLPERDASALPLFLVARSFDINKPGAKPEQLHGAVLGGALKQGKLKIGDEIEIKPGRIANQIHYHTLKTKIVNLFKGSKEVKELSPGGSASIETELDMAIGKSDLLAGNVVSLAGKLPQMTSSLNVKYSLFPEVFGVGEHMKVEQIKPSEMLMLSVGTSMTVGIAKYVRGNTIEVLLKIPIVPFKGDNVGIARNVHNHWRLIGYGEIL